MEDYGLRKNITHREHEKYFESYDQLDERIKEPRPSYSYNDLYGSFKDSK